MTVPKIKIVLQEDVSPDIPSVLRIALPVHFASSRIGLCWEENLGSQVH